jgi:hypothetical protein
VGADSIVEPARGDSSRRQSTPSLIKTVGGSMCIVGAHTHNRVM